MRAAWYEHRGPAAKTLVVGEMPDVEPGGGEVRIKVDVSGLSPGDVKKRSGWQGSPMPYPRVIPHSDGAGTIDAVGWGVDPARIGQRAWCYGAQSYRAFGTAAEYVAVPDALAITLPHGADADADRVLAEQAACLGIAGITGYRAVFADGSVRGLHVLVHGATGGVGSIATQIAVRDGATVIAGVRDGQQARARELGAHHVIVTDEPDAAAQIRAIAPEGIDRIAEVEFASHIDLDAEVIATGGVICSYYSAADRPEIPYWKLGFADTTLRLLGSDDFPPVVKANAAAALTRALLDGSLRSRIAERVPLEEIVRAHELVERGTGGRVVVNIA
ncbi:MAG: NADPH:quinone reductase [Solirubrobacteraceae bacterium]